MAQVIGLGGLFFKTNDPVATREWYTRVLGIAFEGWGGTIFEPATAAAHPGSATVFSPFAASSDYFDAPFMFNLLVDDLDGVLARCATEGVQPVKLMPDEFNGKFAHILDNEGRKIELWEPKAAS